MREFKFRAWVEGKMHHDVEFTNDGWVYDPELGIRSQDQFIGAAGMYGDHRVIKNNVTLMQYTGMKDENGKEIYEGDKIEYISFGEKKESIVRWDVVGFMPFIFFTAEYDQEVKVIGNIFGEIKEETENDCEVEIVLDIFEEKEKENG